PDLTMRYCPILILIDYIFGHKKLHLVSCRGCVQLLGCSSDFRRPSCIVPAFYVQQNETRYILPAYPIIRFSAG
ncbi:hypothetical protein, partial [Neisseria mucosa]|uniref:hypothetical protein n=1 Tax=Neisseria mucosa TaxID=488 RepID=UPI00197E51AA